MVNEELQGRVSEIMKLNSDKNKLQKSYNLVVEDLQIAQKEN